MNTPDIINGVFELGGGIMVSLHIARLLRDKIVRGVSWSASAFFFLWGVWNLYYYPHLSQWFSFWGGVLLVAANFVWIVLMAFYLVRERINRNV